MKRKPIPLAEALDTLPPDGGPEYNRLVFEKSPYLLQHAGNPVDWYPWGEEAFETARKDDKPVFLSIGYSTCHWCHVMEHESFEDEEVAKLMNENFICIKVDREERPDIDQIYMTVTQMMTGSGGWPMTVVMTPDKIPFYAGTYFPKTGRFGRPGMLQLVPSLSDAWKKEKKRVLEVAQNITQALGRAEPGEPGEAVTLATLDTAYQELASGFDPARGGFGQAPKFPVPHQYSFLLRYWRRTGEKKALEMVEKTLTEMRLGGVYDHVGFGTHRYSTDAQWLLPHFEKMLYDQALLALAHLEAWQATRKPFYARVAREIFTYVLRDMTSPEGGFYSAEDADSEGEEGKFYVWNPEELFDILGKQEADLFLKVYNIVPGGNFLEQSTGQHTGFSIPHLKRPLEEMAKEMGMDLTALTDRLEAARSRLFTAREKRVHPLKDDKILTDWNGLMIAALALGGRTLDEPVYTHAASRAADFVLDKLRTQGGRLLKRYRQGHAGLPAHLEDYSFLVWGLLELYEATFNVRYLQEAIEVTDLMIKHFWDEKNGGFFLTADDSEKLLVRPKEGYDGAVPSGNAVAALDLLRIGRVTGKPGYEEKASLTLRGLSDSIHRRPSAHTQWMIAADFALGPSFEIVIAGDLAAKDTAQMLHALREQFIPNKVVLFRPQGQEAHPITTISPFADSMKSLEGAAATAYVCRGYVCKLPTTDIKAMLESLKDNR